MSVELTGVLGGIVWRNAESDFLIAYIGKGDDRISLLGDAPEGKLLPGVEYRFSGIWKPTSEKWGRQFKFESFVMLQPHTRGGVVNYLQKHARGIGPAIAGRLWDAYGTGAVLMLRTEPEMCVKEIDGLSDRAASRASGDLQKLAATEGTMIELANLIAGRGFSSKLPGWLFERWGAKAPELISRDPYKLLTNNFPSCGFGRCDRLYLDLGHDPGRLKRQCLCIWDLLYGDSSGSTWHKRESVINRLGQQVGSTKLRPERAIELGVRSGLISESGSWLAVQKYQRQEELVANQINKILGC